jgi:hypothetical protein
MMRPFLLYGQQHISVSPAVRALRRAIAEVNQH